MRFFCEASYRTAQVEYCDRTKSDILVMPPSPAFFNLFFTAPDEGGISQIPFLHPDISYCLSGLDRASKNFFYLLSPVNYFCQWENFQYCVYLMFGSLTSFGNNQMEL